MARPLEFDKNAALDAAMQQFWKEGYEASSIQKLLDAMGINRGSLYASFGDKESLFRAVLKRYEAIADDHVNQTLLGIEDPVEAIYQYVTGPFRLSSKKRLANGCLMINTLSELSHTEPKLAKLVLKKQEQVEKLVARRLRDAQEANQINPNADCDNLARFILVVVGGLTVRSKNNPDKKELLNIVETAMQAVA